MIIEQINLIIKDLDCMDYCTDDLDHTLVFLDGGTH